jgi:hypothetical protein
MKEVARTVLPMVSLLMKIGGELCGGRNLSQEGDEVVKRGEERATGGARSECYRDVWVEEEECVSGKIKDRRYGESWDTVLIWVTPERGREPARREEKRREGGRRDM